MLHRLSLKSVAMALLLLLLLTLLPVIAAQPAEPAPTEIEGWFSVVHGDSKPGDPYVHIHRFTVTPDSGPAVVLEADEAVIAAAGGIAALNNQRVTVRLSGGQRAAAIRQAPLPLSVPQGAGTRAVTGTQPWVTIMCAFPGTPVGYGTETIDYFQEMYSATYPGIDHYWREQSFNRVNLIGSESYGWFDLPHAQTYYIPTPGSGGTGNFLDELRADCVAAADATVDFSQFVGINMMFNGVLDCCAWGGGSFLTIDGATKLWRLTWNPPWSWQDVTVVAHEVGHGFGLPHANNYDNDGWPYDTPWDVMSDTYQFCALAIDPTYGCLGQHTNASYKDYLGWFNNSRRLVATTNTGPINLDHAALQDADDYQIIVIPTSNSNFYYVVEARQTTDSGYDQKLPGKAVLIWEVNYSRTEWAWQIGATSDAAAASVSNGPDGAWLPDESYTTSNGAQINIISENADGFVVEVVFDTSELVLNGGMEADASGDKIPEEWTGKNLTKDSRKCNSETKTVANTGNCAFAFKGGSGEIAQLVQNVDATALLNGDTLTLSAYVKATNAAASGSIRVKLTYANTTKGKISLPITTSSDYSQLSDDLLLTDGVTKLKLQLKHNSTAGKVYIDDVSLKTDAVTRSPDGRLALPDSQ